MRVSRKVMAAGLTLSVAAIALAQVAPSFTINGKKVAVPTVINKGRVYADAEALAKAMGSSVTYDKAKQSLVIVSGRTTSQAVQGTAQLAGGEGVLGKTYSLGKADNAMNFTLRSAEYSVARVTVGTNVYAPKADEKLLILRYTVQNPQKSEMNLAWSTFKITAVDAQDVNHVFDNYVAREGANDRLETRLKPAQKIDAYLAFAVPAQGVIPKLIVERGDGSPVLRYDLRGKVKALPAPFADPADKSGATALEEAPAQIGQAYPLKTFDLKLESVAYSTEPMEKRPPAEGKRFLVATFAIKNATAKTAGEATYGYSNFTFELRDADGDRVKFDDYLLKPSRDERAEGRLKPGEEARFRVFFELPADLAGKTLYAKESDSRTLVYDVSSAK